MNFFRPGGLNPSIVGAYAFAGIRWVALRKRLRWSRAFRDSMRLAIPANFSGCVPFGDMDANYSNGSSIYHGFTTNLRKRFSNHYEMLASYTWSHSIDDSTDLQSTLTPQDSFYPGLDRSSSLFDQRHRFVFSAVYQTGHLGGGFGRKLISDWTFAPIVEVNSGRPFNIITGNGDNLQLSSLTGRPNATVDPACGTVYTSKYSPTGQLQEPCILGFLPSATNPWHDPNAASTGWQSWTQCGGDSVDGVRRHARFEAHLLHRAIQHGPDRRHVQHRQQNERCGGEPAIQQCRAAHSSIRSAPVPVRYEIELVAAREQNPPYENHVGRLTAFYL